MTAYVRKAERVLTDDDRRLIRRLWRDKLTLSQKILDIDWQLLDLAKEIEGYDITELRDFCRWNLAECQRIEGFDTEVRFD